MMITAAPKGGTCQLSHQTSCNIHYTSSQRTTSARRLLTGSHCMKNSVTQSRQSDKQHIKFDLTDRVGNGSVSYESWVKWVAIIWLVRWVTGQSIGVDCDQWRRWDYT